METVLANARARLRNSASCAPTGKSLFQNNCYDDLCFGVFALSVEIRPSAAGGTCVSWAITISFAEIFSP